MPIEMLGQEVTRRFRSNKLLFNRRMRFSAIQCLVHRVNSMFSITSGVTWIIMFQVIMFGHRRAIEILSVMRNSH
jgi:hypothetical protein